MDPADLIELHELPGRYGDTIDDRDWDALDRIFTADAVFDLTDLGGPRCVGLAAIRQFMDEEARHPKTHLMTNVYVNESDRGVEVRFRIVALLDEGRVGTASYYDDVVKTTDGWRVAHRIVTLRRQGELSAAFERAWPTLDTVAGWLSRPEAELLFALARAVPRAQSIVEIGSSRGRSTCVLAFGAPDVEVYAVDPHTGDRSEVERGDVVDTWDQFNANVARLGLSNIVPMRARSVEAAAHYVGPPVGLLFVDGWHSADAVEQDVRSWHRHLAPAAVVVFDDFNFHEVAEGISRVLDLLPPRVGSIGKDEVYATRLPQGVRRLLAPA